MKRILTLIGAGGLALLATTSTYGSMVFEFSYTFNNGAICTGTLTGDLSPDNQYVQNASFVSVSLYSLDYEWAWRPMNHPIATGSFNETLGDFVPGGAVVSFNPLNCNFGAWPLGDAPDRTVLSFFIRGQQVYGGDPTIYDAAFGLNGVGYEFESSSDVAKWSLQQAVPEPSQWAAMGLILLGAGGYGFRQFRLSKAA